MPSPSRLVTNPSPLLALLAGCGSLELLHSLAHGIWLSETVITFALRESAEKWSAQPLGRRGNPAYTDTDCTPPHPRSADYARAREKQIPMCSPRLNSP